MSKFHLRRWPLWVAIAVGLVALYFLFPFGFPKLPFPNYGPEHRRWLDARFNSREDVIAYLQAHEAELLRGSQLPTLEENGTALQLVGAEIDWQELEQAIEVEQRLGYKVFRLTYQHPYCQGQYYTFQVTSYGLASLYGCCGV
jgi:hypothetical protein